MINNVGWVIIVGEGRGRRRRRGRRQESVAGMGRMGRSRGSLWGRRLCRRGLGSVVVLVVSRWGRGGGHGGGRHRRYVGVAWLYRGRVYLGRRVV